MTRRFWRHHPALRAGAICSQCDGTRAIELLPTTGFGFAFMHHSEMRRQTSGPRRRIRRTGGAMSMRSLIVGAFAASVIAFTAPLALAEEPATPHYTAHHHHDETRHPYSRFRHHHRGPPHEFGMHHRVTTPGCTPWQSAAKTCVCGGSTKGRQFICHPGQWCHPYFGCTL
jgi:hypothetical protein